MSDTRSMETSKMKTYRVTRLCCLSTHCLDCIERNEGLTEGKRKSIRIIHATGLSEESAKRHLKGWASYKPEMELEEPDNRFGGPNYDHVSTPDGV